VSWPAEYLNQSGIHLSTGFTLFRRLLHKGFVNRVENCS